MNTQTKLSAKGQVVIPKDVRERLRWLPGMRLEVIEQGKGITLRATERVNRFPPTTIDDLRQWKPYQGAPKTVDEISELSHENIRQILDQQERDARD